MKKILLSFLTLFSALAVTAQTSLNVGKVKDGDNLSSIPYDSYKGVCSSVDANLIKRYAGSEVVGLRIALGSTAVTNFYAFLSADPNPDALQNDLASASATTVTADWSDYMFEQPYTLTGTEKELYVGYYFSCSSTEERPVLVGPSTSDYGLLVYDSGNNGWGWYDYSSTGDLAVQLILSGANLPEYDIALEELSTNARYYDVNAEKMYISVDLVNKGTKALPGLTLSLMFDDNPELGGALKIDEVVSGTMQMPLELPLSSYQLAAGKHTLTLQVKEAKDATLDPYTLDDDVASCSFYLYESSVERNYSLMEVFATTDPDDDKQFTSAVEEFLSANPTVIPVFIHGNFRDSDPLAVEGADDLAKAAGLQSVPSFGFNRTTLPGYEEYLYEYDSKAEASNYKELLDYINNINPSFGTISLTGKYDTSNRLLTLTAKCTATKDFRNIFGFGGMTIYLTENNVNGQNHVLRKIVTNTLGNVISWNADAGLGFTRDYRITADASWDVSNMQAVAFITKMTSTVTRHDNMDVTNATVLNLSNLLPNAIGELQAEPAAADDATYDLSGRRISNIAQPGLYIRNGKKVLVR